MNQNYIQKAADRLKSSAMLENFIAPASPDKTKSATKVRIGKSKKLVRVELDKLADQHYKEIYHSTTRNHE